MPWTFHHASHAAQARTANTALGALAALILGMAGLTACQTQWTPAERAAQTRATAAELARYAKEGPAARGPSKTSILIPMAHPRTRRVGHTTPAQIYAERIPNALAIAQADCATLQAGPARIVGLLDAHHPTLAFLVVECAPRREAPALDARTGRPPENLIARHRAVPAPRNAPR